MQNKSRLRVVYSGTCLTCAQKDPPSKVDREGNVMILPAPPLTSPPPEKAHTISKYYGESNFGAYTRGQQHLAALALPDKHPENAFVRHREDFHVGEEEFVKFEMEVMKYFN